MLKSNDDDIKNKVDVFANSLEHFSSLLEVWNSKDKINKFNQFCNEIKELLETIKIIIIMDKKNKKIVEYINKIFVELQTKVDKYPGMTFKFLFDNYTSFKINPYFQDEFWKFIKKNSNSRKIKAMLISLASLRFSIIKNKDKKNIREKIYYYIDIDDLVNKIRNGEDPEISFNNILEKLEVILDIESNKDIFYLERIKNCFNKI